MKKITSLLLIVAICLSFLSSCKTNINSLKNLAEDILSFSFPIKGNIDIPLSLNLNSNYCIVYNKSDNKIMYSKNTEKKCFPASLTKLMTAALALEYADLSTLFTIGDEVEKIGANSSRAWLAKGQKLNMEQLLYGLLLASGNDAAYSIAVNIGKIILDNDNADADTAINAFCEKMNDQLNSIGAKSSHFSNPDGYHSEDHYTTAGDMLLITLYILKNETIYNICNTNEKFVTFESGQTITYKNSNLLMDKDSRFYNECVHGMKTGTTDEAGNCLIFTFDKNDKIYIAILLGAETNIQRYQDATSIIEKCK